MSARISSPSHAFKFVDIGVNLTSPMFRGKYNDKQYHQDDLNQVVDRAKKIGMTHMIITGGNLEESVEALELAKELNQYSTVGCHPTRCSEFESYDKGPEAYKEALLDLILTDQTSPGAKRIVAVGECGLDYDRTQFCPITTQKKYFEVQFDLASKTKLPMFLHNRNTGSDFVDMVRQHRSKFTTGVVHSFTGSREEALAIVEDLNLYIGINGCSLKTEENLRVVREVPLERLMIETDAPWCDIRSTHASSQFLAGKASPLSGMSSFKKEKFQLGHMVKGRNEPCMIWQVAEVIAALKSMEVQHVTEQLYKNTLDIFFPSRIE